MTSDKDDFVVSRTLNAPVAAVFKAWTDRAALEKWWGPKGCRIEVKTLDIKPGGLFHYSMEFQPGQKMWGRFIYKEIDPPTTLVFVNSFSDAQGDISRAPFNDKWPREVFNRVTFEDQGGKTLMTLRGHPVDPTPEELELFKSMFGSMQQGFGGTFEQLDAYLATVSG